MRPCIIATYQTPSTLRQAEASLEELIYQAVQALLGQAGVSIGDVDHVAIASSDGLDGRAISCMVTAASAGAYGKDLINSSSSGEHALILACLRILAGRSRLALVANWAKPSEAPLPAVDALGLEPFYHRRLPLERTAFLALQASAYVQRYQAAPRAAAAVVAKNRAAGCHNPLGLRREPVTAEQALNAPLVAWPLRELDLPTPTDGVVVMLVAAEDVARSIGRRFAVVEGLGWATDSYWLGDRIGAEAPLPSLTQAARSAFRQAGVAHPLDDLDVLELSDLTPYHELMAYEAIGLCAPGEGPALALRGETDRGGQLPANPSGGLQAAYPDFAAGLDRVAEVARQVTGTAGEHQVAGVRRGLAQAAAGLAAQASSVFILAGSDADA